MNTRCEGLPLTAIERVYYRDRLRRGRAAALADAEGFQEVCFALEELGVRLLGAQAALGYYRPCLAALASGDEAGAAYADPASFTPFDALFELVREARNDAMHTGTHTRRVTAKAVELCLNEITVSSMRMNPDCV